MRHPVALGLSLAGDLGMRSSVIGRSECFVILRDVCTRTLSLARLSWSSRSEKRCSSPSGNYCGSGKRPSNVFIFFDPGPTEMRRLCLCILQSYRRIVSPLFGRSCRFEPTCSQYAMDAITRYGTWQGLGLAVVRLMKCHPFHPGGQDPVN